MDVRVEVLCHQFTIQIAKSQINTFIDTERERTLFWIHFQM